MCWYRKFRFAFPGGVNEFIENVEELQHDMLVRTPPRILYFIPTPYRYPIYLMR